MECEKFNLLFINVYMPYEGGDLMTDEFADQLATVENFINDHLDCYIIVGGDFNVDLSRAWVHTAMLKSFCENNGLEPAVMHKNSKVDYTYSFNMCRFNILDHFLVSGVVLFLIMVLIICAHYMMWIICLTTMYSFCRYNLKLNVWKLLL